MDFPLEEIMSGSADNHPEVTCIKFPLCFPWPKQTVEGSRHASHKPSGTGLLHVYRTILCWACVHNHYDDEGTLQPTSDRGVAARLEESHDAL